MIWGSVLWTHLNEGHFSAFPSWLTWFRLHVSVCLLEKEGSRFIGFYLYPSVVIDSRWMPASTAVCSCVWSSTCIRVALQNMWLQTCWDRARTSFPWSIPLRDGVLGWLSERSEAVQPLSAPPAAIVASISVTSAHLQKTLSKTKQIELKSI